jgi:peroxiredoxin
MPQDGILLPIPRAAPVAAGAASVSRALTTRQYTYQAPPPTRIERGTPVAGKRGPARTFTTLFILIVCVLVGSGIYFFFHQTGTQSPPENTIDTTILSLQSVSKSTTETGATITWKTDEPSTSQVNYGKTETYGSTTPLDTNLSTSHSVTLTGLDPNTTYNFKVISADAAGNEITSKGELTTLATADKTAPTISGVNVSNITESSAIITWITDEPATSQVKYEKTEEVSSTTPLDKNLTTNHNVTLTKLDSGTTYNFVVISKDASGNETTSATNPTFKTLTPIPVGSQVGNLAPPFTLEDLNGQKVSLSALRGKIVMVNFWATWCDPCKEELPFFQAISDNRSAGSLKILAINVGEGNNTVRSFINGEGYTFTALLDSKKEVNTLYNVSIYPTTFFINADGIIKERKEGSFQSRTEIENILNSLK